MNAAHRDNWRETTMVAGYRTFRGAFKSWETLFREAADFASRLGPERVISISHSEDQNVGVVVVWYWSGGPDEPGAGGDLEVVEDTDDGR